MKKSLLSFLVSIMLSISAFAQMPDGSIAPNWTLTDINGTSYTLYDYLDAGKSVVIDFSAVWCGPCWSYHETHTLRDVYNNYGPSGTDEMMVFFIEGDQGTLAELQGGSGSQGDWITGTPYPIIPTYAPNGNAVTSAYQIAYWPTVYLICPDRVITEVGQATAAQIYSEAQNCPALCTNTNDVKVFSLTEPDGIYCATSITPELTIQNYGTATLTSLTIKSLIDGTVQNTYDWTGNLDQYYTDDVTMPTISGLSDGNYTFTIQTENPNEVSDEDTINDSESSSFSINSQGADVTLDLLTDDYPEETSWEIKYNGNVITSGDNYNDGQHHYIESLCLTPGECYNFTIYDDYGDGMNYGGVTGNVEISYNGTTLISLSGDGFTSSHTEEFCVIDSDVNEISGINNIEIYPNPTSCSLYIVNAENSLVNIYNILGEIVYSTFLKENKTSLDISNLHNGTYIVKIQTEDNIIIKEILLNK